MRISIYNLTIIAFMTAIICLISPITIPFGMIPISLSNLSIYLTILILGKKKSSIAVFLYLLIGFAGIPVFSGFSAGVGKLLGPTGGYLIGYLFLVWIAGWLLEKRKKVTDFGNILALMAGTIILYFFGTLWLAVSAGLSWQTAFYSGVLPFLVPDIIKMGMAVGLAKSIKKRIGYIVDL